MLWPVAKPGMFFKRVIGQHLQPKMDIFKIIIIIIIKATNCLKTDKNLNLAVFQVEQLPNG